MFRMNILDKYLKKYTKMSERELSHSVQSNLWFTPVLYVIFSSLLVTATLTTDLKYDLGNQMRPFFAVDYDLTRNLVGTLTAAILTLTTFTFNLILVVFTTFSGQFSPRMLKNFIASKSTQRVLGIFTSSFIYMLLSFLLLNKRLAEYYFAVPLFAAIIAAFSMGTFIFFINHAVAWLQVNQMTYDMKKEALSIVKNTLENEVDPYKVDDLSEVNNDICENAGTMIMARKSGFIQLVDFNSIMQEAKKDDIVIQLEYSIGSYVYASTPYITYWTKEDKEINEEKYLSLVSIGRRQTEVQDIEFSINKLVEVAIRSLGNYDPKTTINAIYQLGEVLASISRNSLFSKYLVDKENNLRVVLQERDFSHYLYNAFGYIRHYAKDNIIICTEILKVLDLMAKSVNERDYEAVWKFGVFTASGFEDLFLFTLDYQQFHRAMHNLAVTTKHEKEYEEFLEKEKQNQFQSNKKGSEK
ncbi:DUF2254 domain-containing protein [Fictibacillus phosphorivorans]|uniref:DUF2254 domain-containing protein n=1 Tax=Fictibacillus phosphorivorans TaxID=1221500 RepID=UPI00203ABEE7|nr:DUF2254 domain-containing protein [Fictibacillus phosphorivorans]MCM3718297.1 DUF2254 domain-containing protein [Fictibacillus phosphorivorans]MCM3775839.1 DUF2254 domain-containing protein [Fictibacillus phosphorivorans]